MILSQFYRWGNWSSRRYVIWISLTQLLRVNNRGTWVVQSVEHLTSAQVIISRFMSLSPASGSLLSAQNLLWILCSPPHPTTTTTSAPPLLTLSHKNKHFLKRVNNNNSLTYIKCLLCARLHAVNWWPISSHIPYLLTESQLCSDICSSGKGNTSPAWWSKPIKMILFPFVGDWIKGSFLSQLWPKIWEGKSVRNFCEMFFHFKKDTKEGHLGGSVI